MTERSEIWMTAGQLIVMEWARCSHAALISMIWSWPRGRGALQPERC